MELAEICVPSPQLCLLFTVLVELLYSYLTTCQLPQTSLQKNVPFLEHLVRDFRDCRASLKRFRNGELVFGFLEFAVKIFLIYPSACCYRISLTRFYSFKRNYDVSSVVLLLYTGIKN